MRNIEKWTLSNGQTERSDESSCFIYLLCKNELKKREDRPKMYLNFSHEFVLAAKIPIHWPIISIISHEKR